MNNIEKFRKLFLEFEVATRKKVGNDRLNLDECIKELKSKRIKNFSIIRKLNASFAQK